MSLTFNVLNRFVPLHSIASEVDKKKDTNNYRILGCIGHIN